MNIMAKNEKNCFNITQCSHLFDCRQFGQGIEKIFNEIAHTTNRIYCIWIAIFARLFSCLIMPLFKRISHHHIHTNGFTEIIRLFQNGDRCETCRLPNSSSKAGEFWNDLIGRSNNGVDRFGKQIIWMKLLNSKIESFFRSKILEI